jgi:hypothetical protein
MVKKQQGSIWQLLAMGEKAAKLPNYCILLWRLNALIRWATNILASRLPPSNPSGCFRPLFGGSAVP